MYFVITIANNRCIYLFRLPNQWVVFFLVKTMSTYYGYELLKKYNKRNNYLQHYGRLGMKWYQHIFGDYQDHAKYAKYKNDSLHKISQRNYSKDFLDSVDHIKAKKALNVAQKLYDKLNEFDYGGLINGKKITGDDYYDIDFGKDYRTIPIKEIEKNRIGNCWDFVNYQHYYLDKKGIPNSSYMFVAARSDKPDDIITHTFTTFKAGNQNYWFEQAFWKQRGIHKIDSPKDVINTLEKAYNLNSKPYDCFAYNPTGMDKELTDKEYFDRATNGGVLVYQRK